VAEDRQCPHGWFLKGQAIRCQLPWEHVNDGTDHTAITLDGHPVHWSDDDWEPMTFDGRGMTDIEMPLRGHGMWLDSSIKERTYVGCDVCHWEECGLYEEVRARWIAHTHDPIWDVRWRADQGTADLTDLRYVLNLLEGKDFG